MCSDPTSGKSNLYEFKMALFDNGNMEELLLFVRNFNTTLKASGMIVAGAKTHYLSILICGEALSQFDTFYAEVGITTSEKLKYIILGLGT